MNEYLLLSLGGDAALDTFVRRPRLQLELRGELVVEVLGGVVLQQVELPAEGCAAQLARVEHLPPGAAQAQRGLERMERVIRSLLSMTKQLI